MPNGARARPNMRPDHNGPQRTQFESNKKKIYATQKVCGICGKPVETLQRRARAAPETTVKAMHDDRMKVEARFRSRAGLQCFITRKAVNGCCEWCTAVAGRYAYGEEPDGIYRRHDNCDCTVTFENGRKRQDVWSKREWEVPEADAGAPEPVRLTAEQAEALQAKHQLTVLTKDGKPDIIKSGSDNMGEIQLLGKLNTSLLESEFGKLRSDEIIITSERLHHIAVRHPEDYQLFIQYGAITVESPDIIIKDEKNSGTAFFIKKLPDSNLNVVVRLTVDSDHPDYKNSVMTFYRLREKNLLKLEKKNKVLYKKE